MGEGTSLWPKNTGSLRSWPRHFLLFLVGTQHGPRAAGGEATARKLRRGAAPFFLPSGASQPRRGIVKSPLVLGAGYKAVLAKLGVGGQDAAAAGGAGPAPAPEQLGAGGR